MERFRAAWWRLVPQHIVALFLLGMFIHLLLDGAMVMALFILGGLYSTYVGLYQPAFEVSLADDGLIRCRSLVRTVELRPSMVTAIRFAWNWRFVQIEYGGGSVNLIPSLFDGTGFANSWLIRMQAWWPRPNTDEFIEFVSWLRHRNPQVQIEGMDRLEELTRPQ